MSAGPCLLDFQSELTRQIVAKTRGAHFGYREAACGDHECGGVKLIFAGAHNELCDAPDTANVAVEKCFHAGCPAFGFEHFRDVARRAVAEELPEGFLVVRDAVLFDQGDKIRRRIPRQRGFRKVRVCGEKVVRLGIEIA